MTSFLRRVGLVVGQAVVYLLVGLVGLVLVAAFCGAPGVPGPGF